MVIGTNGTKCCCPLTFYASNCVAVKCGHVNVKGQYEGRSISTVPWGLNSLAEEHYSPPETATRSIEDTLPGSYSGSCSLSVSMLLAESRLAVQSTWSEWRVDFTRHEIKQDHQERSQRQVDVQARDAATVPKWTSQMHYLVSFYVKLVSDRPTRESFTKELERKQHSSV